MLHLRDADTSSPSASYLSSLPGETAVPAFVPALVRSDNRFAVEDFAPIGGEFRTDSRDCSPPTPSRMFPETVSERRLFLEDHGSA